MRGVQFHYFNFPGESFLSVLSLFSALCWFTLAGHKSQLHWGNNWVNALLKSLIVEHLVIHSVHPACTFGLATYCARACVSDLVTITTTLLLSALISD